MKLVIILKYIHSKKGDFLILRRHENPYSLLRFDYAYGVEEELNTEIAKRYIHFEEEFDFLEDAGDDEFAGVKYSVVKYHQFVKHFIFNNVEFYVKKIDLLYDPEIRKGDYHFGFIMWDKIRSGFSQEDLNKIFIKSKKKIFLR